MFKEQDPDEVYPAEYESDEDRKNKTYDVSRVGFVDSCGNSYDYFGQPVYAGNEQKKELHEARKFLKFFSHDNILR